jgi:hypothetical protein
MLPAREAMHIGKCGPCTEKAEDIWSSVRASFSGTAVQCYECQYLTAVWLATKSVLFLKLHSRHFTTLRRNLLHSATSVL